MRKHPDNRYACMSDVLADLAKVIAGTGDIKSAPINQLPDIYRPLSEQGQRAYKILHRSGLSAQSLVD